MTTLRTTFFGAMVFVACAPLTVGCRSSPAEKPPNPEKMASDPPTFLKTAANFWKWRKPAEPAHIAGPIYFVGTQGLSAFLITTSDGHILLNTGLPGSGKMIAESICSLGFKPEDIKILLAGHAHVDHVGGHAYIQKLSGASVAMLDAEVELVESGGKKDFKYGRFFPFHFDAVKVDRVLHDGEVIRLGGVALTALHTPGHTRGATTFTMNITDRNGKTYAVVFPDGTNINPGYRLTKNPSYPGIADDFRQTLNTLESLKPDIWLTPHNEVYGFDAKRARASAGEAAQAWVDSAGYSAWIAAQRDKLERETGEP